MGRPREHDPERVLDDVMAAFWERGYEATSIRDLVAAAGVNRATLYAQFGDKHALFLRALARYADRVVPGRAALLARDGAGLAAIREYFGAVVDDLVGEHGHRGCMMVNSAVELAPHDPQVARHVRAHLERLERGFAGALRQAVRDGDLPRGLRVAEHAAFLVTTAQGLMVVGKANPSPKLLRSIVRTALAALS